MISSLFNEILYRPLFNGLILIYNILPWHDLGLSIIVLTVLIRLAFSPLSRKAAKSQRALAELGPQLKEVRNTYQNDKEEQAKRTMALYAEKKVNPFSGCLVIIVQLPILIALYQVFRGGLDGVRTELLYPFVFNPGHLNTLAFGVINLLKPNIFLAILAGLTQFLQSKVMSLSAPPIISPASDKSDFTKALSWQTTYFLPAFIVIWSWRLPPALPLYWTILNIFGILEFGGLRFVFKTNKAKTAE